MSTFYCDACEKLTDEDEQRELLCNGQKWLLCGLCYTVHPERPVSAKEHAAVLEAMEKLGL